MDELVCTKAFDEGAGVPYESVWVDTHLFLSEVPESGSSRRYYIAQDPSVSKTWVSDEWALRFIAHFGKTGTQGD